MSDPSQILVPILPKIETGAELDGEDRAALLALPYRLQTIEPAAYVMREGERPDRSCLIIDGLAYRHKVTLDGGRQIVSVHIPGDFIDLESSLLNIADHNVQALTRCQLALVPRDSIRELILARPRVAFAMWIDTLIDGAMFREWIVNVGRRDAPARLSHLLSPFPPP